MSLASELELLHLRIGSNPDKISRTSRSITRVDPIQGEYDDEGMIPCRQCNTKFTPSSNRNILCSRACSKEDKRLGSLRYNKLIREKQI